MQAPPIVLKGVPFTITVLESVSDSIQVRLDGYPLTHGPVDWDGRQVRIRDVEVSVLGACQLEVVTPTGAGIARVYALPGIVSILPPP
ncbi:hypothetical protein ES703_72441 [subsurface metagenome]